MNHWKIIGADALIGPFGERALLPVEFGMDSQSSWEWHYGQLGMI